MASEMKIEAPQGGGKISIQNGVLKVPDQPIIPFVEGDGTGRDIWRASRPRFRRCGANGIPGRA